MSSSHHKRQSSAVSRSSAGSKAAIDTPSKASSANTRAINAIPLNGPCVVCADPSKFRCSNCKVQLYCSTTHQIVDWRKHQYECMDMLKSLKSSSSDFNLYDHCMQCESIDKGVVTRVYGWQLMCEKCFEAKAVRYFSPSIDCASMQCPKLSHILQHDRAQKSCISCGAQSFLLLRDEMLDEWLVCVACEQMKQLIRCWNAFKKCYVSCFDDPISFTSSDETALNTLDIEDSYLSATMVNAVDEEFDLGMSIDGSRRVREPVERTLSSEQSRCAREFFMQYMREERPRLDFKWISDDGTKAAAELTANDVKGLAEETLRQVLARCGVPSYAYDNLNKNELIYVYTCIAAGMEEVMLIEQLASPSPVISAVYSDSAVDEAHSRVSTGYDGVARDV